MNLTESEIILILSDEDIREKVDYVFQNIDGMKYNMMSIFSNNLLTINFPSYEYSEKDIEAYKEKCTMFLTKNGLVVKEIQLRPVGSTHGFLIAIDGDLDDLRIIRKLKGFAIRSDL